MKETKYASLVAAAKERDRRYKEYENESRGFVTRLRAKLADVLGCSVQQVEWVRFTKEESTEQRRAKGVVELTMDRRMALCGDAFYRFVLRLTFASDCVSLGLSVKTTEEHHIVKLAKEKRTIQKGQAEALDQLALDLFQAVESYFEQDFEKFIQGQPSTLGFRTTG